MSEFSRAFKSKLHLLRFVVDLLYNKSTQNSKAYDEYGAYRDVLQPVVRRSVVQQVHNKSNETIVEFGVSCVAAASAGRVSRLPADPSGRELGAEHCPAQRCVRPRRSRL